MQSTLTREGVVVRDGGMMSQEVPRFLAIMEPKLRKLDRKSGVKGCTDIRTREEREKK